MGGLRYLYLTSMKNRIKRALHKPVTYVYLLIGIFYIGFLASALGPMLTQWGMDTPKGLVFILSFVCCFFTPAGLASYAKRKGMLFRPSDVHFVFSSPVNPKTVLVYTQLKQYLMGFVLNSALAIIGIVFFEIAPWKMALYFVLAFVVQNILESSLVVLLYGNERFSDNTMKWVARGLYLLIAALLLFAAYLFFFVEPSFAVLGLFLDHPFVQCIPIIGWNIAFIRLLILGPTTVNVICTILYLVSACLLFVLAKRMKCTGAYYEDAMKFADDYQELLNKKMQGESGRLGKKQSFKQASVEYKGGGAKAIFYRQLLEYKKNRTFIFSWMTLVNLAVSGFLIYAVVTGKKEGLDMTAQYFLLPGAAAYIAFLFSAYKTKWAKELENPYTYLIPDTPFRKLWYATLMEHIRAVIDGLALILPFAIAVKMSPVLILLNLLLYVCLLGNKLYFNVLSEALLGDVLGATGKSFLRMFGQMIVISLAIIIAVIIWALTESYELAFCGILVYMIIITVLLAIGGSFSFSKMEAL